MLTTLLFADIVNSTTLAAQLGDRRWRDVLDQHHELGRGELARFGGREVSTTGDGFFASFDRPIAAAAVRPCHGGGDGGRCGSRAVIPAARGARPRRWSGVVAWALWVLTVLGLAATARLDQLLREAGAPELTWLHLGSIPQVVAAVSAVTVGAVLTSRRPRHPVGWLLGSIVHPAPLEPEYPGIGNPLAIPGLPRLLLDVAIPIGGAVVLVALVVAAGSLVGRFRRARGVERQQLRWLALAAGLAAVALLVAIAALAMGDSGSILLDVALGVCAALLPLATGAAILRYRLYDIDSIISRTLAYGVLTVLLGGGYVGVVLGLGQLLGTDSSLVVAGATLAVAAAFQPARGRVQRAVDRRFNRRRYDAANTIAAFSTRLREQIDLDTLSTELLGVVDQTMEPTTASLWLRPSVERSQRSSATDIATTPHLVRS